MNQNFKYFKSKDFNQNCKALEDIETNLYQDALPELIYLCSSEFSDNDPFQYMLRLTLRSLLLKNEPEAVVGIQNKNPVIQIICIQVCGEMKFNSSIPELFKIHSKQEEITFSVLFEALSALSNFDDPKILEFFIPLINHQNSLIRSIVIDVIGKFKDLNSIPLLFDIINKAEDKENYLNCDFNTYRAIINLGNMVNEKSISFIASKIHHKNPTARRIIHEILIKIGEPSISFLEPFFEQENIDNKILSANILGYIGCRKSGNAIVNAINRGKINNINVKFAIYEALGKIPFIKGIVCLMDALNESHESVLITVVDALEAQISPAIIERLKEFININNEQSQKILKAIITARALNIFSELYEDELMRSMLIDKIIRTKDNEIISSFSDKLKEKNTDISQKDYQKLKTIINNSKLKKFILAVDDSKAMLSLYRSSISEMDFGIITALNGKEAIELIETGVTVDLVITDMNMPVMDGIEFVGKVRENILLQDLPIIMVTTESEMSQKEIAQHSGVNDFITKPFTTELLENKIKHFLL